MKKDLVQLRVVKPGNHHIAEGFVRGPRGARKGDVFWARKESATNDKHTGYIDSGFAEPVGAGVGPEETPMAGPSETPQRGPTETKSSSGGPDGRSTDSQKSGEPGVAGASSLSPADRVSTPRSSRGSRHGGTQGGGAT